MQELLQQLQTVFSQNAILTTVTSGSIIVWLVSNIKNIWSRFIDLVLLCISFRVENFYEDNRSNNGEVTPQQNAFNDIISSSRTLFERTKNLDLSQTMRYGSTEEIVMEDPKSINRMSSTSLTFGFSIRIIYGKLVFCTRTVNTGGQKTMINTSIRVFFANKNRFVEQMEKNIVDILNRKRDDNSSEKIRIYNGYTMPGVKQKRSMDTIFTNNDEHNALLEKIRKFEESREVYREMNCPYKFCGLLYGKPGTGKTSTILALSSELNRDIRYISMTDINIRDLLDALNSNYIKKPIFVIEDIDAIDTKMNSNRDGDDDPQLKNSRKEEVSMSDFLNVTDGLLSSDGLILLMTTNHIEKLDEAFLRSGRMDTKVEFDMLTSATANRMIRFHLGYEIENLRDGIAPSELQEEILAVKLGKSTKENLERKFGV